MKNVLLLAASLLLLPGSPATAQPSPTFSGSVDVVEVEVPVEVRDRDGQPVRGLTREDFRIYDQGKQREIERFETVDLAGAQAAPAEAATPTSAPESVRSYPRHLLLLFDLTFSSPISIAKARAAAKQVVLASLEPSDLVGVATYSNELGPRFLVTFTPDRAQVARALDSLSFDRATRYRAVDPLRFLAPFSGANPGEQSSDSGSISSEVKQELQDIQAETQQVITETVEREARRYERSRVSNWTRGLEELARFLAAVQGRKQVLLFSEGFDSRLLVGRSDLTEPDVEDEAQKAASGEIWRIDSDMRFGNTPLLNDAARLVEQLKRADCAVNAVDIGGLRTQEQGLPGGRSRGQDGLFYLANESGGQLFTQDNDLADQMRSVLDRTAVTYLLTFRADNVRPDGSWRRLRVDLPGRKGLKAAYRPGWYAPRPYQELHPFERDLLAADTIALAEPRHEIGISVLAVPFRAGQEAAYVPVILEVDGRSLFAGSDQRRRIDIYAYATTREGEFRAFFHRELSVDPVRGGQTLAAGGLKYYGHFGLPPDDYLIRVLVREDETGRTGAEAVPLHVPDYAAEKPSLLQPMFLDAPGSWTLVRERTEGAGDGAVIYPFVVGGEPFVPRATPSFRSGGEAEVFLAGYNIAGEELRLEGAWLTGAGDRPLTISAAPRATGSQTYSQWLAQIDLSGLAAGEHRFRLAVVDARSGRPLASTTGALRIEG